MADTSASVDYRALFHNLPDNYLLMTPEATLLDNSDAHVRVSLLPREQAMDRHMFDAYPGDPQSQANLRASHEVVRSTLQAHVMPLLRYDIARPAALGGGTEERYWQITHFPLLNEHGALQFILQQSQDVTAATLAARRSAQVQHELDEARQRTDFILESLPVLVWTNLPDGTPDYFNNRWLEFTGKTQAEMKSIDWGEITHPDDRPGLVAGWARARAAGEPFQYEYRLRRHDGQFRWLLTRNVPRRDAQGQISMWVGAGSDIHEQRQMVQELLAANEQHAALADQAAAAFRQAENQRETYQTLFTQAPAMIAITRGAEHRYDFVNPAYQQLFPHRQLVGRTVLEAVPEVEPQGFLQLLDHVFQTGETFRGDELKVQLERDASGDLRDTYFNFIYQQYRENDQPAGLLAFAFEVTDLVQARQALEQVRSAAARPPGDAPAG